MHTQMLANEIRSAMTMKMSCTLRKEVPTYPLNEVEVGGCARVLKIQGGKAMIQRLMGLGLTIGSEVEILHHRGKGVVVGMNGNRIAVGHGVADSILVEKLESCGD